MTGGSGLRPPMYYNIHDVDAIVSELRERHGKDRDDYIEQRKTYIRKLSEVWVCLVF